MDFRVFIQARMSSRRFPGKVLAPMAGRPMIAWLLERMADSLGHDRVVLATSVDATDDPLALYADREGYLTHRGELLDVFGRFKTCAHAYPAEWVVRVSGDSPLLDPELVTMLLKRCDTSADVVTNVAERSFPRGQSVEVIRRTTLDAVPAGALDAFEREHVTPVFYRHPERYAIRNVVSGCSAWSEQSFVVDTLEDLRRLEPSVAERAFPVFANAVGTC